MVLLSACSNDTSLDANFKQSQTDADIVAQFNSDGFPRRYRPIDRPTYQGVYTEVIKDGKKGYLTVSTNIDNGTPVPFTYSAEMALSSIGEDPYDLDNPNGKREILNIVRDNEFKDVSDKNDDDLLQVLRQNSIPTINQLVRPSTIKNHKPVVLQSVESGDDISKEVRLPGLKKNDLVTFFVTGTVTAFNPRTEEFFDKEVIKRVDGVVIHVQREGVREVIIQQLADNRRYGGHPDFRPLKHSHSGAAVFYTKDVDNKTKNVDNKKLTKVPVAVYLGATFNSNPPLLFASF